MPQDLVKERHKLVSHRHDMLLIKTDVYLISMYQMSFVLGKQRCRQMSEVTSTIYNICNYGPVRYSKK